MSRAIRCLGMICALLAVGLALAADEADDKAFDRTPRNCISLNRLARTDVLDDQTILFYMHGDAAYLNHLPRKCPNLARQNRFMYQTTTPRLCSIDSITVLEQWASRLERGFTCRLGDFHPLTLAEIEDLDVQRNRAGGAPPGIEVEAVELPPASAEPAEPKTPPPEGGSVD